MKEAMYFLGQKDMPTRWYNILPDFPEPLPAALHPGTGKPLTPPDLAPLFPMELIMQEFSPERYIEIPEEVMDIYKTYRPTVLHRAYRLEKELDTPAKIFYKYEGTSPAGSHKLNTAIAQAYYNKKEGIKRISTETGAGQWGIALSIACKFFNMECKVYMVKVSYNSKPYRHMMMEAYGATCVASPSVETKAGRAMLAKDPDCNGSLGLAISEAVEDAVSRDDTHYSLGSVLNHVILHQSVIGEESRKQMEMAGEYPDIVIGCVGGGSNFGGMVVPWIRDKISGAKPNLRAIAVEPQASPTLTKGPYAYDFGDVAGLTPLLKMYTLGHDFMPAPVHAGGLRYHGMAPIVSHLYKLGLIEAQAVPQTETFEAGILFARTEGILSAPESTHAIKVAIDEAKKCKESGESKNILVNLSGHGLFDLSAYEEYFAGRLKNYAFSDDDMKKALSNLPKVD
jgi:tryptophan synthase beta chain